MTIAIEVEPIIRGDGEDGSGLRPAEFRGSGIFRLALKPKLRPKLRLKTMPNKEASYLRYLT